MNTGLRHFRKHQSYVRRQRELAEYEARKEQSRRDRLVDPLMDLREALRPAVLPDPPACIELTAEAHVCCCSAQCELCVCVPPHASAEEELRKFANAEVERVLNDGNAREHMASKAYESAPVPLSFWRRFKLWFAELVAPACSYREGGVNYRPPVKQQ